jgi:hypothetical protein
VLAVARRAPALLHDKRERSEQIIATPILMPRPRTA